MKYIVELLTSDKDYISRYTVLTNKKIIKHHLLLKCLFYILEYDMDTICTTGTQEFFWKKAKHHWNEKLLQKMSEY